MPVSLQGTGRADFGIQTYWTGDLGRSWSQVSKQGSSVRLDSRDLTNAMAECSMTTSSAAGTGYDMG
jgi:hypothetical protein